MICERDEIMPFEKGGRADKQGNRYEINCIIYEILKVCGIGQSNDMLLLI